jgi:hypothetical protein
MGGSYGLIYCLTFHVVCLIIQGCGGGGSVRRRNTLHVVGGREYLFSQARFMGRENILLYKIRFYIIK